MVLLVVKNSYFATYMEILTYMYVIAYILLQTAFLTLYT